MGLFRKKPDPISARAKQLSDEIAALEAQIQQLSLEQENPPPTPPPAPPPPPSPSPAVGHKGSPFAAPAGTSPTSAPAAGPGTAAPVQPRAATSHSSTQPRLRSTAVPHGSLSPGVGPAPTQPPLSPDPVFEEVNQDRLQAPPEAVTPGHYNDLGVRKYDLASGWQRLKNHFRGPVTSNPKLVHYLSAGSIQGLRPLRYEKRVARNRVIVLAAFLVLALWGVIAIFFSRR